MRKQAGQLVRGDALRVLVPALARDVERLLPVLLRLLEVGQPPGDVGEHRQRLVAGGRILVLERLERAFGEVLGLEHVRVAEQRRLGEPDQREPVDPLLALRLGVAGDQLHLGGERGKVGEPPGGERSPVAVPECRLELGRAHEQLARRAVGLARERAFAGRVQRLGGLVDELVRGGAVELAEEGHGVVEVVGPDLDQLVAGALSEPAREPLMVIRPRGLGQAGVGDLADEDVLEAERHLAADRRARLWQQEVPEQQVVDGLADVLDVR